jgi:hypothetical protein
VVADLQYWHRGEGQLAIISCFALIVLLLIVPVLPVAPPGTASSRRAGAARSLRSSPISSARHLPLQLFLGGLPFFTLALADPFTALVMSDVTYPGRGSA